MNQNTLTLLMEAVLQEKTPKQVLEALASACERLGDSCDYPPDQKVYWWDKSGVFSHWADTIKD